MHRKSVATVLAAALVTSAALAVTSQASASEATRTFTATLSGEEEVPPEEGAPAVETTAMGSATFELSADGTEMSYTLNVTDLDNVQMGHIHVAAPGVNGPIVVWLYPDMPPPQLIEGTTSGTLASGTFTADDLVEDLEGATLQDLVSEMAAGNTYVNVHTEQYPAGEIRGQISEGDAIDRPDRIDTGAGGTAESSGFSGPAALVAVAGLVAVAIAAILVVRRRITT